jgi:hypothetical protein
MFPVDVRGSWPNRDIKPLTMGTPRTIRPGQCAVCTHPDRGRIEALVCGGASHRAVAKRFGGSLNKDNLSRHFKNHVTRERRAELVAGPGKVEELANAAAAESRGLLDQLSIVRSVLLNQFLTAAEAGDRSGVANIAGRLLESLRALGRLTGELREVTGVTVNNVLNLFASPEFTALQDGLLLVARAHPEARADIVALLRSLDAKPDAAAQPNGNERAPPFIEGEARHVA